MTYREKQLQAEVDFLYRNLVWRGVRNGELPDTMIDEDSNKSYGYVQYKDMELVDFPFMQETIDEMIESEKRRDTMFEMMGFTKEEVDEDIKDNFKELFQEVK